MSVIVRPVSVAETSSGVTRSATAESPAAARSDGGNTRVTTSAEPEWRLAGGVGAGTALAQRPHADSRIDPPIRAATSRRFTGGAKRTPFLLVTPEQVAAG